MTHLFIDVLVFDNSYSWRRWKHLYYLVELHADDLENEVDIHRHLSTKSEELSPLSRHLLELANQQAHEVNPLLNLPPGSLQSPESPQSPGSPGSESGAQSPQSPPATIPGRTRFCHSRLQTTKLPSRETSRAPSRAASPPQSPPHCSQEPHGRPTGKFSASGH